MGKTYSVDISTLKKVRKTERKNYEIISADVIYSETYENITVIHARVNIITEWDIRTGTEGAKKAIMEKFEKWINGE